MKGCNGGGVEFKEHGKNTYWAKVPHKHGSKVVTLEFTKDGRDIKSHYCHRTNDYRDPPVCRHVIAAVFAIQNGIVETKLSLGKTATVNTIVVGDNTAEAVGSGSLKVFSTPFLISDHGTSCMQVPLGLPGGYANVCWNLNKRKSHCR